MTRAERRPALSLPYRLRGRGGDAGEGAPPLLLLLHGRGGNELAMAGLADRFDPRFLVVSPRAPIETAPYAYQWFAETFMPDGPRVEAADLAAAEATLRSFTGEAVAALGADPARAFAFGFSQGGTLGLSAVLAGPARFAGVVSMSGWLPGAAIEAAAPPVERAGKPVLVIHGNDDETIAPGFGREAHAALSDLGLAAEHLEADAGHTTTPETIAAASAWLSRLLDRTEPAT